MICEQTVKKFCKDFTKIENYAKAIADTTQTWQCHHRLETHNSDDERRLVDISKKELIALDMYYDRPAEELIFLTEVEHKRFHNAGKKRGSFLEEWKRKLSESHKGKPSSRKGKHVSEETRRKMAEAHKGKTTWNREKHWKLIDGKRVWY